MTKVIVFVSSIDPQVLGGGEKWNINTAKGLKEKGFEIHLVCRKTSRIADEFSKFTTHIFELEFGFDFYPITIYKLTKYFSKIKADVVICNFNKDVSIAGKAAKKANIKTVLFRNGFPLLQKKWKHKLILPFFDKIVTNSNKIKNLYATYDWDLSKKTHVIYNGFKPPEKIAPIKLDLDKPMILGAGRITATKSFDRFILIFEKLSKRIDVSAIIIGDGPEKENIQSMIAEKNLDIKCVGEQASIYPYLEHASLFLHCSGNEGMPNVLLEAMYMGVPVVASDAGATSELIIDGENGFCIQDQSLVAYIEKILFVLRNENIANVFAESAKMTVKNQFDFDEYLKKIKQLF